MNSRLHLEIQTSTAWIVTSLLGDHALAANQWLEWALADASQVAATTTYGRIISLSSCSRIWQCIDAGVQGPPIHDLNPHQV
jgi:hypothetical protein